MIHSPTYLIIGNGRLATHIKRYFDLLAVPYLQCTRKNLHDLKKLSKRTNRILVLLPDDQIDAFVKKHKALTNPHAIWIHCSGALSIADAESAHPLASFSENLFDLKFYKDIPFFTEQGRKTFPELFPDLPNPQVAIKPNDKPLYHAWSCMAGNFTTLLWQGFFKHLKHKHDLPTCLIHPYLLSVSQNLIHSRDPLTGPLKRNDQKTIERHLGAIDRDVLKNLYQAFVKFHEENKT